MMADRDYYLSKNIIVLKSRVYKNINRNRSWISEDRVLLPADVTYLLPRERCLMLGLGSK